MLQPSAGQRLPARCSWPLPVASRPGLCAIAPGRRRPSNISREFWFSLLWGHCSFPLGLGVQKTLLAWVFSSWGASVGFLTRYDGELREPLVWPQGSQVSMRPIFPSGCEGKLGVALESLQGLRDLT